MVLRLYEDMVAGRISEAELQYSCWIRRRRNRLNLKERVEQGRRKLAVR